MSDQTDMLSLGAVAVLGYYLIKKLQPVTDAAAAATNTVTSYVEKVTEKVEHVTDNVSIIKDTAERYYTPSGIVEAAGEKAGQNLNLSDSDKNKTQTVIDNAKKVNDYSLVTTPAVGAGVNLFLDYTQGLVKGSGSKSSVPVASPFTGITPDAGKYADAFASMYAPKVSGSPSGSTSSPVVKQDYSSTVKASKGGYSAAKSAGTTVNAGKYETIKVKK